MRYLRRRRADGGVVFAELPGADSDPHTGEAWALDAAPWDGGRRTGQLAVGELLAPVAPSKIICVGRNYRAHAEEMGSEVPDEPLLFFKPPSSLLAPGGVIELPPASLSTRVEHEVELGVVVGKRLRRANEAAARDAIFGYTVVGDITARDMQRREQLWTRAKGMDTFCPVGPCVTAGVAVTAVRVRAWVNGALRQDGDTALMVFTPAAVLAYISQTMTLEPGDLVATGTPAGVGPLVDGDELVMQVDGIGRLDVRVSAQSPHP